MDEKEVKDALDAFERDDFVTAKEKLSGQIKQAKNDFLKAKLGLKNDIEKQFVPLEEPDETDKKNTVVKKTVERKPRRARNGSN